jgi:hypothetical protein
MDPMNTSSHATPHEARESFSGGDTEKKPYSAPEMVCWGTLESLTLGLIGGTVDGNFSGSGGV